VVWCVFLYTNPVLVFASVVRGDFTVTPTAFSLSSMVNADGNRGDGYLFLWANDGANATTSITGTPYTHLGASWSAGGTNAWTSTFACASVDAQNAYDCPWDAIFAPSANVLPAGSYILELSDSNYTIGDTNVYYPLQWDGTSFSGGAGTSTRTRIIAPLPADGSTSATTTTTVGADVYINDDQFLGDANSWSVRVKYALNAYAISGAGASPSLFFVTQNFPIGHGGESIKSTTTPALAIGTYTEVIEIRQTSLLNTALNFFSFGLYDGAVVASETYSFTIVRKNGFDSLVASTTEGIAGFVGVASTTATVNDCVSFHISDCLLYLFLPPPQDTFNFQNLSQGLERKPPFGYFSATAGLWGALTTTTPSQVIPVLAFPPLQFIVDAAVGILYGLFGFWLWRRITQWNWHL